MTELELAVSPLPLAACGLGESPFWHPDESRLWWVDIPGRRLWCHRPGAGGPKRPSETGSHPPPGTSSHPSPGAVFAHPSRPGSIHPPPADFNHSPSAASSRSWPLPSDPGCIAPLAGGGLLLACRDGLWRLPPLDTQARSDPVADSKAHHFSDPLMDPLVDREPVRELLAAAPYDPALQRFNDGRADPQGRFWVGTIHEPRSPALAHLYRFEAGQLSSVAGGITVSNGLAFSPDGRTLYWSDTTSHTVHAFDFNLAQGSLSRQRVFARFPPREPGASLASYGGRPDGAAVDAEGCYWVAMFEGAQLLRLSPGGEVLARLRLPVQCPTMPCFGGPDLRTLFITTARLNRPPEELASQPWAGCVLQLRVDTPGLPVNFAKLP